MTAANYAASGGLLAIEMLQLLSASADLLVADQKGWTAFRCAGEGDCFRFVLASAWSRLTWTDIFMRHLDHIFTYVNVSDAAASCKAMGAHARYLGNPRAGLEDAVANVGWRHLTNAEKYRRFCQSNLRYIRKTRKNGKGTDENFVCSYVY